MTEGGVSPVPREARPYQGLHAGLVTRLIANTIDSVVVVVFLVIGWLALNGLRFLLDPRRFRFSTTSPLLTLTAGLVVAVLYLAVAWATTERTYGCHIMGLRVLGRRKQRLRPATALLRAVLCVLFPIGLLWCALSRERLSLQDIVLRTCVVYGWEPRHPA